jgi:hypothetical protein
MVKKAQGETGTNEFPKERVLTPKHEPFKAEKVDGQDPITGEDLHGPAINYDDSDAPTKEPKGNLEKVYKNRTKLLEEEIKDIYCGNFPIESYEGPFQALRRIAEYIFSAKGEAKIVDPATLLTPEEVKEKLKMPLMPDEPWSRKQNDIKLVPDRPSDVPEDNWAYRSKNMTCQTCMWYVPKGKGAIGRCRHSAPTMKGWPAMFPTDWCGCHKLDETRL